MLIISSSIVYFLSDIVFEYFNPETYNTFTPGIWAFILCLVAILIYQLVSIISKDDPSTQQPIGFGPKDLKFLMKERQLGLFINIIISLMLYLPLIFSNTTALSKSISIVLCLITQIILYNVITGVFSIIISLNILWICLLSIYLYAVTTKANFDKLISLSVIGFSLWLPILATFVPGYLQLKIVWDRTDWRISKQHRKARFLSLKILTFILVSVVCVTFILIPIFWQYAK